MVAARAADSGDVVISVPPSLHITSDREAADVPPFDIQSVSE